MTPLDELVKLFRDLTHGSRQRCRSCRVAPKQIVLGCYMSQRQLKCLMRVPPGASQLWMRPAPRSRLLGPPSYRIRGDYRNGSGSLGQAVADKSGAMPPRAHRRCPAVIYRRSDTVPTPGRHRAAERLAKEPLGLQCTAKVHVTAARGQITSSTMAETREVLAPGLQSLCTPHHSQKTRHDEAERRTEWARSVCGAAATCTAFRGLRGDGECDF